MPQAPISVVVPVRNGARFIGEALRSIFDQTVQPNEVIVVDDGSTDDTAAQVSQFPNVIYVRQPPLGQSAARNHGIRLATKSYLSFLDADDFWLPNKTELQLDALSRNASLDCVTGQMVNFRDTASGERLLLSPPAVVNLPSLMLIRRAAFLKIGAYSLEIKLGEALEWWARAIDGGLKSEALQTVVLMRRIHGTNIGLTTPEPMRHYLRILHTIIQRRRGQK